MQDLRSDLLQVANRIIKERIMAHEEMVAQYGRENVGPFTKGGSHHVMDVLDQLGIKYTEEEVNAVVNYMEETLDRYYDESKQQGSKLL